MEIIETPENAYIIDILDDEYNGEQLYLLIDRDTNSVPYNDELKINTELPTPINSKEFFGFIVFTDKDDAYIFYKEFFKPNKSYELVSCNIDDYIIAADTITPEDEPKIELKGTVYLARQIKLM